MKFFDKVVALVIFVNFGIFVRLYSILTVFRQKKHPKIATDPLNRCSILQICLGHLECILIFPKKLLVKMRYGDVRKVLRLCSLFTIFAVQKPRKKLSQVFKESVASDNFFFTVWITCSAFSQNCQLRFYCHICMYFLGNVHFLWWFLPRLAVFSTWPKSRDKKISVKVMWDKLNIFFLFKTQVKVFDKFVSYITYCKLLDMFYS